MCHSCFEAGLGSRQAETMARVKEWFRGTGHSGIEVEMRAGYHLCRMTKYRRQLVTLCNSLKGSDKHLDVTRASNKPMLSQAI